MKHTMQGMASHHSHKDSMSAHHASMHGTYHNEEVKPHMPKEGHSGSMYDAKIGMEFKGESMAISYGMFGKAGYEQDSKRIEPYMMYNGHSDQNGY